MSWLKKKMLGTVYWLEAPALYVLFMLVGYALWAILKSKGVDESVLRNTHVSIMGVGAAIATGYVWLVSENTSKRIFTILARLSALIYVGLYVATVIWGMK